MHGRHRGGGARLRGRATSLAEHADGDRPIPRRRRSRRPARSSPSWSPGTGPTSSPSRWTRWRRRRIRSTIWSSSTTGRTSRAREVVEARRIPATYLPSRRNLGGAGGFALGMLHALALGADWVWLADDDGRAADETVLATLLDVAQRTDAGRGVADGRATSTTRSGWRSRSPRAGLAHVASPTFAAEADGELLPGIASLFNGALFRAGDAGGGRRAGPAAVRPRRRGGAAPAAGAVRAAVRHLPGRGLPAPARHRRVQADPRRPDAHPVPRRRRRSGTTPTATAATW